MNWIPYGPDAWLLRFADELGPKTFAQNRAIVEELEQRPPAGLREFVPGFATMLLEFAPDAMRHPDRELDALAKRFRRVLRRAPPPAPIQEIPVVYDGPDLGRVAEFHGLTAAEVTRIHQAKVYHVYLIGFSPGFPYLGDLDRRLWTPRRPSPRPRVPAGSVAIGGQHTGIYSVDSPGGWNIIGRTTVAIFDPNRRGRAGRSGPGETDPAMFQLKAGDRVRFGPVAA